MPGYTAVLLDRDGVINEDSSSYIKSPDEWRAIPGSLEAIAMLCKDGLQIGVATNQSGLARGLYSLSTLQAIHAKMYTRVEKLGGTISALRYCPHHPDAGCACRKPKPAMLEQLLQDMQLAPHHTCMVGDSLRDIEAARAAGVQPVLVLSGKGQDCVHQYQQQLGDTPVFADLAAMALAIHHGGL